MSCKHPPHVITEKTSFFSESVSKERVKGHTDLYLNIYN